MSNITKLKEFLLEHRTDYLSATRFVLFSSKRWRIDENEHVYVARQEKLIVPQSLLGGGGVDRGGACPYIYSSVRHSIYDTFKLDFK